MSRVTPTAVLQAAISSIVDTAAQPQDFIPSASFEGVKPGFYFTTGSKGVGYYNDLHATTAEEPASEPHEERTVLDPEKLLEEAEAQAGPAQDVALTSKTLKRAVLSFERKYKENLEMRMKYADQPEKFLESELELDQEIKGLLAIAGSPQLYSEFIQLNAVPSLLTLLGHDNSDIASDVIELFQELTDADVVEDWEDEVQLLVSAMLDHNALELLVQRLTTLNEAVPEEQAAVFNTLAILENFVEVRQDVAELVVQRTKLLRWLLSRLKTRETDSNKLSASEILSILVQNSEENQRKLAEANGIDIVLQLIAPFKNRDPKTNEEEEFLQNLFLILCSSLMVPENKAEFVKAEGIELMILILKQKRQARFGAAKAVDFALTNCSAACERFVDVLGLKTLFAMLMGKSKVKHSGKEESEQREETERVVSIIRSLLVQLPTGSRRDRVAAKFVENHNEKCDRIVELFLQYGRLVAKVDMQLQSSAADEDLTEDDIFLRRLDAGLYMLQQCAMILGQLWVIGDYSVCQRLLLLLHQAGHTSNDIQYVLEEYLANVGDESESQESLVQVSSVRAMLSALGRATNEPPVEEKVDNVQVVEEELTEKDKVELFEKVKAKHARKHEVSESHGTNGELETDEPSKERSVAKDRRRVPEDSKHQDKDRKASEHRSSKHRSRDSDRRDRDKRRREDDYSDRRSKHR